MKVFLFFKNLKKCPVYLLIFILIFIVHFYFLITIPFKSNSKTSISTTLSIPSIKAGKKYAKKNMTSLPLKPNSVEHEGVMKLFNHKINNNTVLIFEHGLYHQECTPGYAKYFLDLGYKVDIIFDSFGLKSFCLFDKTENIRIFTFYSSLHPFYKNSENFKTFFKNYRYILIESTQNTEVELYKKLGLFEKNNTIFVVHGVGTINATGISIFSHQNRIWSLGNLQNTLFVNPHYFGNVYFRKKNNVTTFFIQSNSGRNYTYLSLAAQKLKKENLDFKVIVIGKVRAFTSENISEELKDNFIFRYSVGFTGLYKAVDSCDYIIINLYPGLNDVYRSIRLTGAAQLSYGFFKPALIHKSFANFYNMSYENSFLFDDSNFYEVMREAILLTDEEYQKKQNELIDLSERLYNISLYNVNKTLNSNQ